MIPDSPSAETTIQERQPLRVCVLGATGLVGRAMVRLLEERQFPVAELVPLASAKPRTDHLTFRGESIPVRPVRAEEFAGADLVLSSAGGDRSREWLPVAVEAGAVCIDNTSAFRMDPEVPLIVPEVNGDLLDSISFGQGSIIANPNCSTIQLVVALEPLRRAFGLERVLVSTYQSISGAGRGAVERFTQTTRELLEGGARAADAPPAFDVLPLIGDTEEGGPTTEERKMLEETPKILREPVPMDVTCVRVPVFTGHAEAVSVQTKFPVRWQEALQVLSKAPGIQVHPGTIPPTPAQVAGDGLVHVGRVRPSQALEHGLQFWVVADNLLKGAAWNAVQIAEQLVASQRCSPVGA